MQPDISHLKEAGFYVKQHQHGWDCYWTVLKDTFMDQEMFDYDDPTEEKAWETCQEYHDARTDLCEPCLGAGIRQVLVTGPGMQRFPSTARRDRSEIPDGSERVQEGPPFDGCAEHGVYPCPICRGSGGNPPRTFAVEPDNGCPKCRAGVKHTTHYRASDDQADKEGT